jgi:hypothetical protein
MMAAPHFEIRVIESPPEMNYTPIPVNAAAKSKRDVSTRSKLPLR